MWKDLLEALARFRRVAQEAPEERRTAIARERFWAEVHEGEAEAEAHSRTVRELHEERLGHPDRGDEKR